MNFLNVYHVRLKFLKNVYLVALVEDKGQDFLISIKSLLIL